VDDNRDAADSLAVVIRKESEFEVHTAYSPKEVGNLIHSGLCPAVVFMDVGLPEMDGYAVARELRKALPYKPLFVAITGYPIQTTRSNLEGFDYHFMKPADPLRLLGVLNLINGKAAHEKPTCGT
jgi:CheY-like chemotaxis protein